MKTLLVVAIIALMSYWAYLKYPQYFGKVGAVNAEITHASSVDNSSSNPSESAASISSAPAPVLTPQPQPQTGHVVQNTPPPSTPSFQAGSTAYLLKRASQVTDQGVFAIQQGEKVTIVSREGAKAVVTNGSVTMDVDEEILTTQAPAVAVMPQAPSPPPAMGAPRPATAAPRPAPAPTAAQTEREKYFAQLRAQEEAAAKVREHNRRIYNQLQVVESQISSLRVQMSGMSQQSRARYRGQMEDLEKQRAALQAQLQ